MKGFLPSNKKDETNDKKLDELSLFKSIQFDHENEIMTPAPYEKSFLRNLSIILEARESVISLKNEESALRKEAKLELTDATLDQVHKDSAQQSLQYASCFLAADDKISK